MKISACYIVKDEADELRRSIGSLADTADEIIVVSTAGVSSIAAAADEFHATHYDFTWEDDFAAARNFALAQAHGDIIIFLDADEYFFHPSEVRAAIEEYAAASPPFDIVMVPLYSFLAPESLSDALVDVSPRILRGKGAMIYQGRLHEQAFRRDEQERNLCYADERLACGHTGYIREVRAEKIRRNITMLNRDAEEHGRSVWHAAYLADCYFGLKDYARVLELSYEALSSDVTFVGMESKIYHQMLESMRALHYPDDKMLSLANIALSKYPDLPDFHAERGMIFCGMESYERAIASLSAAMECYEHPRKKQHTASFFNRAMAALVAERLMRLYLHLNDTEEAEKWEKKARMYQMPEETEPAQEEHVHITACYIVRDDAVQLKKSIESLRAYVDEVVVVDTGSADDSPEVARELGAEVYHIEWKDDFAAARNEALLHAHGDWIVFPDADEYFSPETAAHVPDVIHAAEEEGMQMLLVPLRNIDERTGEVLLDAPAPRIFKAAEGRRYVGRIHEELRDGEHLVAPVQVLPAEELQMIHTGYSADLTRAKGERNLRLLLAEMESSPQPERCYRYLAETYDRLGNMRMAEHYALLDVAQGRQPVVYASASYRILLHIYGTQPQLREKRRAIAEKAAQDFPELPEMHAEYAEACAACHSYQDAIQAAEKALSESPSADNLEPSQFTAEMAAQLRRRMVLWQDILAHEKEVRISACVFARDDVHDMAAWLENAAAYADERIVLDTGSSDGTRELAVRAGASVHDFVWGDDFAAARNAVLGYAKGDWAAVLDADETFFNPAEVRPYLAMVDTLMPEVDGVLLPIVHVDEDADGREMGRAPHVRLLRMGRGLFYEGRVHEQLKKEGGAPRLYHEPAAPVIRHVGYSPARIRAKHERNLVLLAREIERRGMRPGDARYLADTYFGLGQYASALLYTHAALEEEVQSVGAQSHLHHLLLDCMAYEDAPLAEQISAAQAACAAFPLLPDFHGRLGLLLAAAQEADALPELTRALALFEMPKDASGESSAFQHWLGEVSAMRARLLMERGEGAAAEEELGRALASGTAREEVLDVYVQLHAAEEPEHILRGLRGLIGMDREALQYLFRFADSYGWLMLAKAAADALHKETEKTCPLPTVYEELGALSTAERGEHLTGQLARLIQEMPEHLLRLKRERSVDSQILYRRLRGILPDAVRAFWRHYDEPDAAPLPAEPEGYGLVVNTFVRHADDAQMEQFISCAGEYGIDHVLILAKALMSAQRWRGAIAARLWYAAQGGAADAAHFYEMGLAYLHLGFRREAEESLTRACAMDAGNRRARELMELIR